MHKKVAFGLLFISLNAWSSMNLSCSHPEICRIFKSVTQNQIPITEIVVMAGDPHEFEPSSSEIKELLTSKVLVTGPTELTPWMKKILYLRAKDLSLTTIILKINPTFLEKYSTKNQEALSHFWLYPDIYCDLKKQITELNYLKKLNIKLNTQCNFLSLEKKLISTLNTINTPIILSHDALSPLISYYSKNKIKIITIKGSGHHDEVSASSIKTLYDTLEIGKVIWILETNINIPENIKNKVRLKDKILKIDTTNSNNYNSSEFAILEYFINELNR